MSSGHWLSECPFFLVFGHGTLRFRSLTQVVGVVVDSVAYGLGRLNGAGGVVSAVLAWEPVLDSLCVLALGTPGWLKAATMAGETESFNRKDHRRNSLG